MKLFLTLLIAGTALFSCAQTPKKPIKIPVAENHPFPLMDHNPVKAPKQQQGRRNSGHSRHAKPKSSGNSQKKWYGERRGGR